MKKLNCMIADDEALAREVIESHVQSIDRLQLVAVCSTGIEVYNTLKTKPTDLLFLDIQMPQLTGIELLRTLKILPAVIITSAYREFAIEGYELNVIDYLLKPVSFERFLKAVEKYEQLNNLSQAKAPSYNTEEKGGYNRGFIYIKSDKKMVRVMLKDLLYIEGLKDYVKVHTSSGSVITYQTLTYFEEKLSNDHFIRVHRSYIVSLSHINAYSAVQIEIGKVSIPIGNSYVREFLKQLNR